MRFGSALLDNVRYMAPLLFALSVVSGYAQEKELTYAQRVSVRGYKARVMAVERVAGQPPKAVLQGEERGNYQIWGWGDCVGCKENEDKKVSMTLDFVWPDRNRPIPLAAGMEVTLGTDDHDKIHVIQFLLDELMAVRKRADGLVEVIGLMIDEPGTWPKPKGIRTYVAICPNTVQLGCYDWFPNVVWTDKEGLRIAQWHGTMGDESDDSESRKVGRIGWPIANEPNVHVIPGRDGWKLFRGLPENFWNDANLRKYLGSQFD